ncbi:MAG: hypothetical protein ACKVZH_08470 [Blastocatellia bacterium]
MSLKKGGVMNLQTGTIEITGLRFETLRILDTKARESGKSVEDYTRELIEEEVSAGELTFDEILAPIRKQVEESGITDEELDELFLRGRKDFWKEQQGRA